jgi:hypothetical protein
VGTWQRNVYAVVKAGVRDGMAGGGKVSAIVLRWVQWWASAKGGDQSSHRIVNVDGDPRGVRSDVLGRERTDAVVVPTKEYVGEWSVVGDDSGAY